MNEQELQAIEERANRVTPGEWYVELQDASFYDGEQFLNAVVTTGESDIAGLGAEEQCHADAAFIAHARTDVPALIAEVRSLRAKLDAVQVYARGIYGEVPPISFEDWYVLVQGEVQP